MIPAKISRLARLPLLAPLLTPTDAATRLAVSRSLIYKLLKRGDLRAVYVGRLPRIDPADLEAFLDSRRSGGDGA
jgi:excisionase family DNA binding protein